MIKHDRKSGRRNTSIFIVQKKAPMPKRLPNNKPRRDAARKPLRRSTNSRGARPNQAHIPRSNGGNETLTKREEATVSKRSTLFFSVTSSDNTYLFHTSYFTANTISIIMNSMPLQHPLGSTSGGSTTFAILFTYHFVAPGTMDFTTLSINAIATCV